MPASQEWKGRLGSVWGRQARAKLDRGKSDAGCGVADYIYIPASTVRAEIPPSQRQDLMPRHLGYPECTTNSCNTNVPTIYLHGIRAAARRCCYQGVLLIPYVGVRTSLEAERVTLQHPSGPIQIPMKGHQDETCPRVATPDSRCRLGVFRLPAFGRAWGCLGAAGLLVDEQVR